jgi:hypothetical protein
VFHTYVLAYGGDVNAAYDAYANQFPPQPKSVAPPVGGGKGGTVPPAPKKQYTSFDDAIEDTFKELQASR